MDPGDAVLLIVTGFVAGAINAAVGSGSLITYPALLSLGIPPVAANGTNSLGVVPGALSGAWMYRKNLEGMKRELIRRGMPVAIGAVIGAILVVALPAKVFEVVVPFLILGACAVIAIQPVIARWIEPKKRSEAAATVTLGGIGIYGGYFGAGQGVALLAALTALDGDDLHRANAGKNIFAAVANATAAVVFAISGLVFWLPALVICCASLVGGFLGGGAARRLPKWALRTVIVVVGLYAAYISIKGLL